MTLIIVVTFLIFSMSVLYLYRMICRPLSQFRRQMVQIGDGTLQAVHEESDIAEFDSLMREVEQMKGEIENLISNMVEKLDCGVKDKKANCWSRFFCEFLCRHFILMLLMRMSG